MRADQNRRIARETQHSQTHVTFKCNFPTIVTFSKFVGFLATKKFVTFYTTGPRVTYLATALEMTNHTTRGTPALHVADLQGKLSCHCFGVDKLPHQWDTGPARS